MLEGRGVNEYLITKILRNNASQLQCISASATDTSEISASSNIAEISPSFEYINF